jgi:hypothetical protein
LVSGIGRILIVAEMQDMAHQSAGGGIGFDGLVC